MIRIVYIDRDDMVKYDRACFAVFDTLDDQFMMFCDRQVWASWNDFVRDFNSDCDAPELLERIKRLFTGYFESQPDKTLDKD